MRRASFDKNVSGTKQRTNIVNAQGWYRTKSSATKDVEHKRVNYGLQANNNLQRSVSADNVVIRSRGFKPSDRHDPSKRQFLEHLTSKILHFEMDSGEATPINLQKLLTPAMDTTEFLQTKNKKMYASSCFYAPTHPTVEDQVELARRISYSLSDVKNMKSKGQSMYVNRKKRSVKWIHDGNGDDGEEEPASPVHKDKVPLKCMMNPNGKVLDLHGIQALGEEVNMGTSPANAEKLFDIVRDLNNQKGRGAEIFAKRRKRSEKWVVDKEQYQTPPTPNTFSKSPNFPKLDTGSNENAKFTSLPPLTPLTTPVTNFDAKPFYNPFTLDLSLESVAPQRTGNDQRRGSQLSENGTGKYPEVKKIYLREIAVGTEPEYPLGNERGLVVEKSKRVMSFEPSPNNNDQRNVNRRNKSLTTNGSGNGYSNTYPKKQEAPNRESNGYSRRVVNSDRHPHTHQNPHSHHHHHHHHHHRQQYQEYQYREQQPQQQQQTEEIPDENEYTPVPVKQLIQEFEKTCRPILQYKQISPKVIPIVQQCPPLDNDISRFFESSQHQQHQQQYHQHHPHNQHQHQVSKPTGNGMDGMPKRNGAINNNNVTYNNGNGYGAPRMEYGGRMETVVRHYEEYDSSEDDDIDDSFGDSESEVNYRRANDGRMYEEESQSPVYANGNDTRATSNGTMDEYEMYVRQFDESSELFEAPPGFRNGDSRDCDENGTGENLVANDPKSMVLAMVASQEDILDTIKHLRNTPVLENLIGAPSPADFYADVGNNKLCESTYQGPKIASFQALTNYNTAPRGWDQAQTFYRPVTFGTKQEPIAYSDF